MPNPPEPVWAFAGDEVHPPGTHVHVLGVVRHGRRMVRPVAGGEPFETKANTIQRLDPPHDEPPDEEYRGG